VKVRAVLLLALSILLAWVDFVVFWMVLLLLPAVAVLTSVFVLAAVRIGPDEVFYLPVGAKLLAVVVDVRLATEVLPVVSIYATFFVVILTPGAPDCLEVEHVKVSVQWINIVLMKQVDGNLFLGMCKGT
jgi:hypothetical protein